MTPGPQLAHKANHQGIVAAEVAAGRDAVFEPRAIPFVEYTDPELAECGLSEEQAKAQGIPYKVARFPWQASGRATTLGESTGLTKFIIDPDSERVLGVGIVGVNAGELISEAALAIEMGATTTDVAMTIHPHPTLSETHHGGRGPVPQSQHPHRAFSLTTRYSDMSESAISGMVAFLPHHAATITSRPSR